MKIPVSTPLNLTKSVLFGLVALLFFACGQKENKSENNPDNKNEETGIKSDTIKIPEGPINYNPDKTEYATFSNAIINDSVNTIHSIGVQLALVAFHNWMKETGAEVDQLEVLNYMLMAQKNNPEFLLDDASYVADAGLLPEIGNEISKEMARKYGYQYYWNDDGSFLVFTFLQKKIQFKENLNVTDKRFNEENVYYIESNDKAWNQVNVYYYAWKEENGFSAGDFIVELYIKDTNDRIIVAQVKPEKTLAATWKKIEGKINDKPVEVKVVLKEGSGRFTFPHRMNANDYFSMPAIDLEIDSLIPELQGTTFKLKGVDKEVEYTNHYIYFRFDNYGVILIEEAYATDSAAPEEEIIIELPPLVINRPFMIAMKRKTIDYGNKVGIKRNIEHLPYFLGWINNTSVMIPYPKNEN